MVNALFPQVPRAFYELDEAFEATATRAKDFPFAL
jgi:hypothetical protein